ncbi:L-threonine 3-dehydrogenase [soil metagenome]
MLALGKTKPIAGGGLELVQRDVREPGPGEILLRVKAAGICGSDVSIYNWGAWYANRLQLPRVLGHEMGGIVESVGAGVSRVKKGDNVSLESHVWCGRCYTCQLGRTHICPNTKYPGTDFDGTFAEYITVPEQIAWVNPPGLAPELAAALEPFGIAVHATLLGTGVSGQTVVVNGCGPIGLMNVAVARHYGARAVIAIDPNPLRRATALRMGADRAVDPVAEDVVAAVNDSTQAHGADVVFEYTGNVTGAVNAFKVLTPGGDLRWCATPQVQAPFDFMPWRGKRPTIYTIHGRLLWSTWIVSTPLVYENRIDLSPVLSHTFALKDAQHAFDLIAAGQANKPILIP